MSEWFDYFNSNKERYVEVYLTPDDIGLISLNATRLEGKDSFDYSYKIDSKGIGARWFTGLTGEYAVSKVLKKWGLIDNYSLDIKVGLSPDFDKPDFLEQGFNVGCKTASVGRVVKVKEIPKGSEIICVYNTVNHIVYICGIATKEILEQYSDLDLIEDIEIKAKSGTSRAKTGFNRFDKLLPFNKEVLQSYKIDLRLNQHYSLTGQEKQFLVGDCTYIEQQENQIVFRHHTKGVITEDILPYPFTRRSLRQLENILKPKHPYIGFKITPILQELQTLWSGHDLIIEVVDLWKIFLTLGGQYKLICATGSIREALNLIFMLYNPILPRVLDSVNSNFFTVLWVLTR